MKNLNINEILFDKDSPDEGISLKKLFWEIDDNAICLDVQTITLKDGSELHLSENSLLYPHDNIEDEEIVELYNEFEKL